MDSSGTLPMQKIAVIINRGEEDGEDDPIVLVFKEFDNLEVALSESTVDDIKKLFDIVFEYISTNKKLVEFDINDSENDLFNQVAIDIIDQLNAEIKESEDDFTKIWELVESDENANLKDAALEI